MEEYWIALRPGTSSNFKMLQNMSHTNFSLNDRIPPSNTHSGTKTKSKKCSNLSLLKSPKNILNASLLTEYKPFDSFLIYYLLKTVPDQISAALANTQDRDELDKWEYGQKDLLAQWSLLPEPSSFWGISSPPAL